MKIFEILSILDLSKKEPLYFTDDFLNEFDIREHEIDLEKVKSELSYIWIVTWYCTDTWVGIKILLINDEPVCCITQVARRCDQDFEWISNEGYFKVKKLLEEAKIEKEKELSLIDLDQEFGHSYKISFANQLIFPLHQTAFLYGKKVQIERIKSDNSLGKNVKVKFSDNKSEIVSLDDLEFPLLGLKNV